VAIDSETGPSLQVEPTGHRAGLSPDQWIVAWHIRNTGHHPVQIEQVWLPHGKFRSPQRQLLPSVELAPGGVFDLELPVTFGEPPGNQVENAFLIFRARCGQQPWRVLARLAISADEVGGPRNVCETITTHPIGFSV
jgi:hypothetical protein